MATVTTTKNPGIRTLIQIQSKLFFSFEVEIVWHIFSREPLILKINVKTNALFLFFQQYYRIRRLVTLRIHQLSYYKGIEILF